MKNCNRFHMSCGPLSLENGGITEDERATESQRMERGQQAKRLKKFHFRDCADKNEKFAQQGPEKCAKYLNFFITFMKQNSVISVQVK